MKVLIFILSMVLISSCVTSSVFEEDKAALASAPNVVYGHIIDKIDLYETYNPYRTRYIFHVEQTIKGHTSSDTISLLSQSGKTIDGHMVSSTFDWQFSIGDERILIMYPIHQSKDSFEIKLNELSQGENKVDYKIKDQYEVRERIVFIDGKTKYTKPKIANEKMIKLMKKYINDPNKVVPKSRMKI